MAKVFKIYCHYCESQLKIVVNVISFQQSMDQLLKCLPDTNQLKTIRVISVIINSNEPNVKDLNEQINDIIYKISIQEFNNKYYLLGNYPCLYPYEIGSFSSFKIDKLSFRE